MRRFAALINKSCLDKETDKYPLLGKGLHRHRKRLQWEAMVIAPRMDPAKQKLQKFTSYYGILTQMDPQGRILIPQPLREDAQITGDVIVIGQNDHLEVWNSERIREKLKNEPLTDADRERLALQGF